MNAPSTATLQAPASSVRRAARSVFGLLVLGGVVWVLCQTLYLALPYTRSGANVIYDAKVDLMRKSIGGTSLFAKDAKHKVLVLGTSKVLSGFVPTVFDEVLGDGTSSFNGGLPGEERFMNNLATCLSGPDRPDVVLLTMPWSDVAKTGDDVHRGGDGEIMDAIFPFRHMPRDLCLFLIRSRSRGGLKAYYQSSGRTVTDMTANRGYYFIEGQSHFENNLLPDDFVLESDRPEIPLLRTGTAEAAQFKRLCELLETHKVKAYYVPLYYRRHEFAPAAPNAEWQTVVAKCPNLSAIGPDYWQFDNAQFADPVHLNPAGAEAYTRQLAELLRPVILSSPASH